MTRLVKLINLLEVTRSQPQYGYALAGGNARLGNLAEHHYLVAMLGWQLTKIANKSGANINTYRTMQLCLVHDLGEIFGGDLGTYYAKANPKARECAKQFEKENMRFLVEYFSDIREVRSLVKELRDGISDEVRIAKIADYLELTHYKLFANALDREKDMEHIVPKLKEIAEQISEAAARQEIIKFIDLWMKTMGGYGSFLDASLDALGV